MAGADLAWPGAAVNQLEDDQKQCAAANQPVNDASASMSTSEQPRADIQHSSNSPGARQWLEQTRLGLEQLGSSIGMKRKGAQQQNSPQQLGRGSGKTRNGLEQLWADPE